MSIDIFEFLRLAAAILMSGTAIKLMDDYLDLRADREIGKPSLAAILGQGTLPYALIALSVAAMLQPFVAASLFLASYAIGMASDWAERMPTRLKGYQESLLALLIGYLGCGLREMTSSFAIVVAIQILDDMTDRAEDKLANAWNSAFRLGQVEAVLLGICCLWLSLILAPAKTIIVVFLYAILIFVVERRLRKQLARGEPR